MKEIWVSGSVGWDMTAQSVAQMLREITDSETTINLNTPGGSVYEGVEIYNVIKQHPGQKTIKMGSLVASAGSYISAAGDKILAHDFTSFMIHEVRAWAEGTAEEIKQEAERIEKLNVLIANRLANVSSQSVEKIREWMKAETWFYGQEIVDAGFASELIDTGKAQEKDIAVAMAREQYKHVASLSNKKSPGVAGETNTKQEQSMNTKQEVLDQAKNLFENGKLTLREFADHVGASQNLVTPEHAQALSTVNELSKILNTADLVPVAKKQAERIAELAKTERASAITEAFGPSRVENDIETNLVREYANERIGKDLTGEALASAIEEVKNSAIAKRLAAEMADPYSGVNRIDSNGEENKGEENKPAKY